MSRSLFLFLSFVLLPGLSMMLSAKNYKGAEYRTHEEFLYGRFDVRYKPANREGVVSSFFTYHEIEDSTGWNEIDLEFIGRYNNTLQLNVITPGQQFHIRSQHLLFDPYSDFHEYSFEWTPDYVAWFIDGAEVYRQSGEHISLLRYHQKIMMNIWNPVFTNWVGYFDDSYLPAVSVYDYVQYSRYTPGNGNYGSGNSFTVEWKDNFDEFDENRWAKAAHTFAGNQADFDPENIVFSNGHLHLYLTDEINKSGIDNIAPKIIWARANYDSTISIKFSEEISNDSGSDFNNYILPGGKIISSELSENKLYANLKTENYDPFALNNLIYSNLTDLSSNSNVSSTQVVLVNNLDTLNFPLSINVGGDAYGKYLADQEWNSAAQYGYLMGDANTFGNTIEIEGSDDDGIFLSERKGLVTYKFKVPNGVYSVALFYAANERHLNWHGIFNVYAEDQLIEESFDILASTGLNKAYSMEKVISVEDGVIDIYFEEEVDSAFVNAIIVDRVITDLRDYNNSIVKNEIRLFQNYPNPFNPYTKIEYSLSYNADVRLAVYDITGREIELLVNKYQTSGYYEVEFNAAEHSSGVYIYRLKANNNSRSKKMLLIK